MKPLTLAACGMFSVLSLIPLASAQESATEAEKPASTQPEKIGGEEIKNLLVGNTEEGECRPSTRSCRITYTEYYTEDGRIIGKEQLINVAGSPSHYVGRWSVRDDLFCTSTPYRPSECVYYLKVGEDSYQRFRPDGSFVGFARIVKGDPENLSGR
jgi:hypothetical protein